TKKTSKSSGSSGSSATGSGSGSDASGSGTTATKTPPKEEKKDDISVDCLLDPSKCGGSGGSKSGGSGGAAAGSSSGPAKLSVSDIKAGIATVKDGASACGPKNGAAGGTSVEIKFSVSGASGKVSSATAVGDFAGKPLANCVAAAAKGATFIKCQAASQGFLYKLRM